MYVSGNATDVAIKFAGALLALLIVAITVIVIADNDVPDEFSSLIPTLAGALVGFLAGTRFVPSDVEQKIETKVEHEIRNGHGPTPAGNAGIKDA